MFYDFRKHEYTQIKCSKTLKDANRIPKTLIDANKIPKLQKLWALIVGLKPLWIDPCATKHLVARDALALRWLAFERIIGRFFWL